MLKTVLAIPIGFLGLSAQTGRDSNEQRLHQKETPDAGKQAARLFNRPDRGGQAQGVQSQIGQRREHVQAVLRRSRIGVEMDTHIRLGEKVEVDCQSLGAP